MKLSIKQYATILDEALSKAHDEHTKEGVVKDFANLLIEDGRISRLSDILNYWKGLYNKRHGIIDVTMEVTDKKDASFPHSFAHKKVALEVKENKSLIGGSITKIGDYIVDTSIKSKISALR